MWGSSVTIHLSPHWGPVELIRLYVSVSLSVWSPASLFGYNNSVDRYCAQRMQPQATGSNPLSGSMIYLSVSPPGFPWAFCSFFICINFQCGGPVSQCIYPPVGFSRAYMSILPSPCMVVLVNFWQLCARPVIARSACGRRPQVQIP